MASLEGSDAKFRRERFEEVDGQGYRVQRCYKVIGEADLPPGIGLKDLKLPIDEIQDERGGKLVGVLVPKGDVEILMYRDIKTSYGAEYHSATRQLRSSQGKEICEYVRSKPGSAGPSMPSHMRQKSQHIPTEADVAIAIKEAQDNKLVEAQRSDLLAAPAPPVATAAETTKAEDVDEVVYESLAGDASTPAFLVDSKGARSKGEQRLFRSSTPQPQHTWVP